MNIRQRKAERHKESLRKLSQEGGNKNCFDCGMRGPLYIVSEFCILVCSTCSSVHRSFQHKVKGITMSEFTEDEIARFAVSGNDRAHKVWLSTFRGRLPSSGDMLALKDHVRDIFEERRCCSAPEYAALQRAWENPNAAKEPPALSPPPTTTAVKLAPAPEAPAAAPSRHVSTSISPTPASTADTAAVCPSPAAPARPPQNDIFDSLFAAPVVSPSMPTVAHTAPAPAPAPTPPTANANPPHPPAPAPVASLVDDLFAGAPTPAMAPTGGSAVGAAAAGLGGFGNAYPAGPQANGGYPASGGRPFDFMQSAPFAQPCMPAPFQVQQPIPHQQQQQQQPIYPSSGTNAQGYAAPLQSHGASLFKFTGVPTPPPTAAAPAAAAPYPYSQQQQQQHQQQTFTWGQPMPAPPPAQPTGMYGSNPQVAGPYGSGALSQPPPQSSFDFTSGAPSSSGGGGGAPFAPANMFAPQPYMANPAAPGGGAPGPARAWGVPSPVPPANSTATPNRSRITVLSVSKPPGDGASIAAPQWS